MLRNEIIVREAQQLRSRVAAILARATHDIDVSQSIDNAVMLFVDRAAPFAALETNADFVFRAMAADVFGLVAADARYGSLEVLQPGVAFDAEAAPRRPTALAA